MIDTVVFDFDGTLADTSDLVIRSFQTAFKVFKGHEMPVEYIRQTFGEPLKVTLEREFDQPYEEVLKVYKEYQNEKFKSDVKLFDGAYEILEYLKKNNINIAMVTARTKASVLRALEDFKILDYFDIVMAVEDTKNHKPHPEPLLNVIKHFGTTPEKTLFIGDSRFDMECAINAGALPVLVSWHEGSKELAEKYELNYLIDNLFDISKIL